MSCLICLGFVWDPELLFSPSYHPNANSMWGNRGEDVVPRPPPPPPLLIQERLQSQAGDGGRGWQWKMIREGDDSGLELRMLDCTHTFHKICLGAWIAKTAGSPAERMCPLCFQLQHFSLSNRSSQGHHQPPTDLLHRLDCREWQLEAPVSVSAEQACCSCCTIACWPVSHTASSDMPAASTSLLWARRQTSAARKSQCAS